MAAPTERTDPRDPTDEDLVTSIARPTVAPPRLRWLHGLTQRPPAMGAVGVVGVIVVFDLASRAGLLPRRFLPPAFEMLATLVRDILLAPAGWSVIWLTVLGWALSFAAAVVIGTLLGLLLGSTWWLFHAVRPIVEFIRPMPKVALVPLAILLFGIGMSVKVFLAGFGAVWPVLYQAMYGIRATDPIAMQTARSYGFTPWQRFRHVVLPGALPYLMTGMRLAASIALVLVVVAELVIGSPGIGAEIGLARSAEAWSLMYGWILASGLLGLALNTVLGVIERRLLFWHPSMREGET